MIKSFLFWQNTNSLKDQEDWFHALWFYVTAASKVVIWTPIEKAVISPLKTLIMRAWAVGSFLRLTLGCFLEWDKWASGSLGPRLRRPNHRAQCWEIISFPPRSASDGFSSLTRSLVPPLSVSTLIHKRVLSKSRRPESTKPQCLWGRGSGGWLIDALFWLTCLPHLLSFWPWCFAHTSQKWTVLPKFTVS